MRARGSREVHGFFIIVIYSHSSLGLSTYGEVNVNVVAGHDNAYCADRYSWIEGDM